MLTDQGHIKAIDFATAKYFNSDLRPSEMFGKKKEMPPVDEGAADEMQKRKYDRSSTFVGTALYVSPELLEDSQCSAPADLWALGKFFKSARSFIWKFLCVGCVIFLMTTGKMPFHANNEFMIFQQIKQVKIQWPAVSSFFLKGLFDKFCVGNKPSS